MDSYKVLGVTPETNDDDVKRAYRELARKYHPDNYTGSPLADLAEERMKEINEAYDQIMAQRNGKTNGGGAGNTSQTYGGYQQNASGVYGQVRNAINAGNLGLAEELLRRHSVQDAEWNFLMGTVYFRKGWYDEASRCYHQACAMDPGNQEYRGALNVLNMTGGYGGYRPMQTAGMCECCSQLICLNCLCNCCCGNGC